MSTLVQYEVFALKYAETRRVPGDVFMSADPHDAPLQMDYFVWLIRGSGRVIVVDTGFGEEAAVRRKRTLMLKVDEALAQMDVVAAEVEDVVITHLHYDHAGNLELFPSARFHLQDLEMSSATGRRMADRLLSINYDVEDVCTMVRRVYAGRVEFHDGDAEIAPGVTLHRIGGHTEGLMAVRIATARGNVILASDAMHYFATKSRRDPFPAPHDADEAVAAFERLDALADSDEHLIPGHDPLVCQQYPRVGALDVFKIHEPPAKL